MSEQFFMTTSHSLEGYAIVEQLGIVFGETVFKHSLMDSLSAGIGDFVDGLRLQATEMSGSMSLIEKARSFAYDKLIDAAKQRGANAVIAVESDNTMGNNVMYISLYGTAVKVVPVSEKDAYYEQKRIETERLKELADARRTEIVESLQAVYDVKESGDIPEEEIFLQHIADLTSMSEIWYAWRGYDIASKYPDVDRYLESQKELEDQYGVSNAENVKKDVAGWLRKQ